MGTDADIDDQHRIDADATRLFDNLLPADWQKFSITPDYFCDYMWEPQGGVPSRADGCTSSRRA